MTTIIANLGDQVKSIFDLSLQFDLQKMFRRGERELSSRGDITFPLQPLVKHSNLSELKPLINSNDNVAKNEIVKKYCDKIAEDNSSIDRILIDKGTVRVFFNRCSILTSFPEVSKLLHNKPSCSSFSPSLELIINHIKKPDSSESIHSFRGDLCADHLHDILAGSGFNVTYQHKIQKDIIVIKNNSENLINKSSKILIQLSETVQHDSENNIKNDNYSMIKTIIYGPVMDQQTSNKLRNLTKEQYLSQIKQELDRACRHKLGNSVSGDKWDNYLNQQADACARLQLLSVAHYSPVKVSLTPDSTNSRDGAFILYNYARICMIFNNFEKLVLLKYLPSLPDPNLMDFSLLQHNEEWELYWIFIHYWQQFISSFLQESFDQLSFGEFISGKNDRLNTNHNRLPLHKIVKFLHRLTHTLSVYYKTVHILPSQSCGKVQSHLLPKLWARLYLLKNLELVMRHCFLFLKINPPSVM